MKTLIQILREKAKETIKDEVGVSVEVKEKTVVVYQWGLLKVYYDKFGFNQLVRLGSIQEVDELVEELRTLGVDVKHEEITKKEIVYLNKHIEQWTKRECDSYEDGWFFDEPIWMSVYERTLFYKVECKVAELIKNELDHLEYHSVEWYNELMQLKNDSTFIEKVRQTVFDLSRDESFISMDIDFLLHKPHRITITSSSGVQINFFVSEIKP